MTEHDHVRKVRAEACDRNSLESLSDAIRGLQSTDDPSLLPLHDELMAQYNKLRDDGNFHMVRPLSVYSLHSPKDKYYGEDEGLPLRDVLAQATEFGLTMVDRAIPDGLNKFEEQNPDRAVIFDIRSEDVVMVEAE